MPETKTPHTQTQQNHKPEQTDLEPDQLEQTVGTGEDAALYVHRDGAQTGDPRGPQNFPPAPADLNTEPPVAAWQGDVATRTPGGSSQGITSHAAGEESARQEKVVQDRPDAQAGVNHSQRSDAA